MVRRAHEPEKMQEDEGEEKLTDRSVNFEKAPEPTGGPIEIRVCSLSELRSCPTNPRKVFKDLEGLGSSLREVGQIEPIVVRKMTVLRGETLSLVACEVVIGELRFRAARLVGLPSLL